MCVHIYYVYVYILFFPVIFVVFIKFHTEKFIYNKKKKINFMTNEIVAAVVFVSFSVVKLNCNLI